MNCHRRRAGHLAADLLAFAVSPDAAITVCLAAYAGPALTTAWTVFLTAARTAPVQPGRLRGVLRHRTGHARPRHGHHQGNPRRRNAVTSPRLLAATPDPAADEAAALALTGAGTQPLDTPSASGA